MWGYVKIKVYEDYKNVFKREVLVMSLEKILEGRD